MSQSNYDKLKTLLKELFQFDQADLDFGIYRIMNQKREEIEQFLEKDLLPQVKESLKSYQSSEQIEVEQKLYQAVKSAKNAGFNPDDSPIVRELKAKYEKSGNLEAVESEIYSDLYHFFNRYYEKGDFISKRRYKEGVYAIPYEGEEVKLHWANADQYYIKTSEYFKDYTFRLPKSKKRVHFKIVEASTEKDNNKEQNGEERYFVLVDQDIYEENNELIIPFEYRTVKGKPKQEKLNEDTVKAVFASEGISNWIEELKTPEPTKKNKNRTLLEKQLNKYTARNKFDYFIHKDLGGFLRRELDFYIKNEIMHLDDLNTENELHFQQYLSKIKVIKDIGHKIIAFLEQIENFQKKLWLKKKFVVEANYCVTLDRIPEELYPEIIQNEAQIEEWKKLFAIDEIEQSTVNPGYSEPLTEEFLQANPYLVLDTRFFDQDFKEKLIADQEDLDGQMDGLLIHSENFQALNLLQNKYHEKIKCIYIDPPYNSPSSEILYKNNFKHSSWLTLMENRLNLSKHLSTLDGSTVVAIDKHEQNGLFSLLEQLYSNFDIVSVSVEHNKKGTQGDHFSFSNEYAVFAIPEKLKSLNRVEIPESEWDYSNFRNWGGESLREDAANCFYPVYVKDNKIMGFGQVCGDDFHPEPNVIREDGVIEIYPIDDEGVERKWRYARQTVEQIARYLKVDRSQRRNLQIKLAKATEQYKTMWYSPKYNAGDYGTKVLNALGLGNKFDYPKSIHTVKDCITAVSNSNDFIVDYFAGSGTTGQVVVNQNREDDGNRKYILVEMGEYFDTVLKPRIQKVIYSKDWKNGKPVSREGSSHMFKYIRLESYEDTLNNLTIKRDPRLGNLLEEHDQLREQYLLSYMLDKETDGSPSLLNIDSFQNPFDYSLMITRHNESRETTVDLVETFNYLIGLYVESYGRKEHFQITLDKSQRIAELKRSSDEADITFQEIEGKTNEGEKVLVIWRTLSGDPIRDNAALDAYFSKRNYNTLDFEFDRIFVNGDNNLENLKTEQDQWKVKLIEEEFKQRMFDVQDV